MDCISESWGECCACLQHAHQVQSLDQEAGVPERGGRAQILQRTPRLVRCEWCLGVLSSACSLDMRTTEVFNNARQHHSGRVTARAAVTSHSSSAVATVEEVCRTDAFGFGFHTNHSYREWCIHCNSPNKRLLASSLLRTAQGTHELASVGRAFDQFGR